MYYFTRLHLTGINIVDTTLKRLTLQWQLGEHLKFSMKSTHKCHKAKKWQRRYTVSD